MFSGNTCWNRGKMHSALARAAASAHLVTAGGFPAAKVCGRGVYQHSLHLWAGTDAVPCSFLLFSFPLYQAESKHCCIIKSFLDGQEITSVASQKTFL